YLDAAWRCVYWLRAVRGVAQPGSASALGAEGRVFKSRRPDHFPPGFGLGLSSFVREIVMLARIFQPARTATQSGKARTKKWVLEFEPERARTIEPLMGWTASSDMRQQVSLEFDTLDEAIAYVQKNAIPFQIFE